jgi:hypothetical protein
MADVSKLKHKSANRFGPPPSMDEASTNILVPEVAAGAHLHEPKESVAHEAPRAQPPMRGDADSEKLDAGLLRRRDGRTFRRTGRVIPFSTRISPEMDDRLRDLAEQQGVLIVEVLENALEAYIRELSAASKR